MMTEQNRGASKLTKNSFLGVPYEYPAIAPVKPTEAVRCVVEPVDTALQMEETAIRDLQREEYRSFAPILPVSDPNVQAVSFRNPAVQIDPSGRSEALRRARAPRLQQQDAPVEPRVAPLVMSPEIERMEKRAIRAAEQSIVPIQRKSVA
jgi:hypothetical protein